MHSPEPFDQLLTQGMVIKDGAKMSKSKGNVVDPDRIIEQYGADTARLFILFAAPPVKDLEWSDQGVEGCYRFLKRVSRIFHELVESTKGAGELPTPDTDLAPELKDLRRMTHITIKRVTDDTAVRMQFNTAIAAIMELVNHLYNFREGWGKSEPTPIGRAIVKEALESLVLLLAPFAPHIAEDMWSTLGYAETTDRATWPVYNEALMQADEITIVVQINGKVRQKLTVPKAINEDDLKSQVMDDEKILPWLEGKTVRKVIVVPGKLVNIVV